jgi:hypothetical protein
MGVAHRVGNWAGLRVARTLSRSFPIVGTVVAVAVVGRSLRRKGWKLGLLDTLLDALPFVGTAKAGVELYRGDLFPDKLPAPAATPVPTTRA